jgi:hypothetical protein
MKNDLFISNFRVENSPSFNGITSGTRWNGWQMPSFPMSEIVKINEWLNAEYASDSHFENVLSIVGGDVFVKDNDEVYRCETIEVFGVIFYEIDGWCWESAR